MLLILLILISCNKLELKYKNINDNFLEAVNKGYIYEIEEYLEKGVDVNYKNSNGRTALMIASLLGFENIIKLLVDRKADIDALDEKNINALYLSNSVKIFNLLIDLGANTNINRRGIYNFLKHIKDFEYNKNLNYILQRCKIILLKNIENGISLDSKDFKGNKTLIMYIYLLFGKDKVIELLEKDTNYNYNLNLKDNKGETIVFYAIKNNHLDLLNLLIDKGANINNSKGRSPLIEAFYKGNLDLIKCLLSKGASVDITNGGSFPFCWSYSKEILEELSKYGFNVNLKDCNGDTILRYVTHHGDLESLKFIIDKSKDLNAINKWHESPLIESLSSYHSPEEKVKLLITNGAFIDIRDNNKNTPLILALSYFRDDGNTLINISKFLIESGADVNAKNDFLKTPLTECFSHEYIEEEMIKIATILLEKGANLYHKDIYGRNALDYFLLHSKCSNESIIDEFIRLVESKININLEDYIPNKEIYVKVEKDETIFLDSLKTILEKDYSNSLSRIDFIRDNTNEFIYSKDYDILKELINNDKKQFAHLLIDKEGRNNLPIEDVNFCKSLLELILDCYKNKKVNYFYKYNIFFPCTLFRNLTCDKNYLESIKNLEDVNSNFKASCTIEAYPKTHIKFIKSILSKKLVATIEGYNSNLDESDEEYSINLIKHENFMKRMLVEKSNDEDIIDKNTKTEIKYTFYSLSGNCYKDVLISYAKIKEYINIKNIYADTFLNNHIYLKNNGTISSDIEKFLSKDAGQCGELEELLYKIEKDKLYDCDYLKNIKNLLIILKDRYILMNIKEKADLIDRILMLNNDMIVEILNKL